MDSEATLFTPPQPLCDELHIAMEQAAMTNAGSMNALRLAVTRFTTALRDEGASPEAVLIALKNEINSRTFFVTVDSRRNWKPDELQQQISTWSIQEFFSERKA